MHTDVIKVDKEEAQRLFRKYKEHVSYSNPIDWEIQRAYQLIGSGKVVIRAIESIKNAGLNREFLPKLAIVPAISDRCYLHRTRDGSCIMDNKPRHVRGKTTRLSFGEGSFVFPIESFPFVTWGTDRTRRETSDDHEAMVPIIPIHLRPKRGLQNYHILFEAEWKRVVPRDPMLLRRIGKADLWLVVASWELTEVEVAALSTRVSHA